MKWCKDELAWENLGDYFRPKDLINGDYIFQRFSVPRNKWVDVPYKFTLDLAYGFKYIDKKKRYRKIKTA